MLVVNQGESGTYYIFRGTDAQVFLDGIRVVTSDRVVVKLPGDHNERAVFLLTKGGTGVLTLESEGISDALAKLAYSNVWRVMSKQLRRPHDTN